MHIWMLHTQLEVFNGTMHMLAVTLHIQNGDIQWWNAHACRDFTYSMGCLQWYNGTRHMQIWTLHTKLEVCNGTMHNFN